MKTTHAARPRLPTRISRFTARLVALAASIAFVACAGGAPPTALASVPTAAPVFTTPLVFTSTFFPFAPGAMKVNLGRSDGVRVTDLDIFRSDTRSFVVGIAPVACRILQEVAFEGGDIVEISTNYFAQADDGTVWYFGETVDTFEKGVVTGHGGSWLVGGPAGGDPPGTMTVAAPAMFMPANPEVGDVFRPEDLPDGSVEIDTIHRLGRKVTTPAGKFTGCIEVHEFSPATGEKETKWYAPGVGVVATKTAGEQTKLDSTTLRAR
jgi:hypothetical protein